MFGISEMCVMVEWISNSGMLDGQTRYDDCGEILSGGSTDQLSNIFRLPLRVHPSSVGVHPFILRIHPRIH